MSFKKILLAGLILASSAYAESKIVFALNNQYFSETMPKEKSEEPKHGQMLGARYDVGDVIVSTNLSRWTTGVLGALQKRNDGYFVADIKQPLKAWTISANVTYRFYGNCKEESTSYSIRIGANNGESIYITTNTCDVVVGDKQFKLRKDKSLDNTSLHYFVKTEGDTILVRLNGQTLITLPKGEFDTLKTVEISIGSSLYGNPAYIKNLTISQK